MRGNLDVFDSSTSSFVLMYLLDYVQDQLSSLQKAATEHGRNEKTVFSFLPCSVAAFCRDNMFEHSIQRSLSWAKAFLGVSAI